MTTTAKADAPAFIIRELGTRKEVHRVTVQRDRTERYYLRILSGMLINLNTNKYYVDDDLVFPAKFQCEDHAKPEVKP